MRPLLHPSFVNGRFGDPAIYVEHLFERHALLFDLGDITDLPARKINRVDKVFVSHTHVDHFIGFDHLLRVLVGRKKTISIFGPHGLIAGIEHKLHAYQWNLADRYANDLAFVVTEIGPSLLSRTVRFRLHTGFTGEAQDDWLVEDGILVSDPALRVTAATLDHGTPSHGSPRRRWRNARHGRTRRPNRSDPISRASSPRSSSGPAGYASRSTARRSSPG